MPADDAPTFLCRPSAARSWRDGCAAIGCNIDPCNVPAALGIHDLHDVRKLFEKAGKAVPSQRPFVKRRHVPLHHRLQRAAMDIVFTLPGNQLCERLDERFACRVDPEQIR